MQGINYLNGHAEIDILCNTCKKGTQLPQTVIAWESDHQRKEREASKRPRRVEKRQEKSPSRWFPLEKCIFPCEVEEARASWPRAHQTLRNNENVYIFLFLLAKKMFVVNILQPIYECSARNIPLRIFMPIQNCSWTSTEK